MTRPVLPDTDVLIDFLRGNELAVDLIERSIPRLVLSAVVVAELYAGVRGDEERQALDRFTGLFRVLPVTASIAKAGGLYRRKYRASHGVGLADALVAATVDAAAAELMTLNVKHYPMLDGLEPAYRKT